MILIGATLGVSVPSFILAAVLIQLFAFTWPILPAALWKGPAYVILPALALAAQPTAFIMRLTRSSLLDALGQDYIRTAKAKGVSGWKIIFGHALKNSLIPVITYFGPMLAYIVTGSLVVEQIFAIPGIGSLLVSAIQFNDYNVVLAVVFVYSVMFIAVMLAVDILYGVIDPRIRLAKEDG